MTYRDDLQAIRMRRDALARELHQVRSRMDELHGLAQTADALERELAQCSRDLDQARPPARRSRGGRWFASWMEPRPRTRV